MDSRKPWLKDCGDVPHTIDYPEVTMDAELTAEEAARQGTAEKV